MQKDPAVLARYREALTPAHQEALHAVALPGSVSYSDALLGTEPAQLLIDLYLAGYLYCWGPLLYVAEEGKKYLLQLGYSNAGYRFQ